MNKSSFFSGAGTYLVASLINAAIPFLLLPILTRFLSPEEYGEIAVFQVWVSLMGAACGLSVHGAAARKHYDFDRPDRSIGEFIFACLVVLLMSTVGCLLLVIVFSGFLSDLVGLSRSWLIVGVLYAGCNFLSLLRLGQWQVRRAPGKFGIFQILQSLLNMTLSLALVVGLGLGATGRMGGMTLSIILFGALALLMLQRDGLITPELKPKQVREALAFGVPLIPHVLGAFLLLTVDRAVISATLGLEQAGYYMVAVQFALILSIGLDSINRAFVPWLFERLKKNDVNEKLAIVRLTYGYYLALAGISGLAFIGGGYFVVLVAGESYKPAADLVGLLILGQAFRGCYLMVTNYIYYSKRTGLLSAITISSGVVNLILVVFLIKVIGLQGAALAFCISMFMQWIFAWHFANRLVPMPWGMKV